MFENFPYTNFHDINLDWIVEKVQEAYSPDNPPPVGMVASVNGKTGIVVLTGEDIKAAAGDPDSIKTILDNLAAGKQDAPAAPGISGQFLGLDVNGDPVWATPSGSGTTDYDDLTDKPQIEGVTLAGNKSLSDLGAQPAPAAAGTAGQVLSLDNDLHPVWAPPAANDYDNISNKPEINSVQLSGNKSLPDLGIQPAHRLVKTITTDGISTYDQLLTPLFSDIDALSEIERIYSKIFINGNYFTYAAKAAGNYYYTVPFNTNAYSLGVYELTLTPLAITLLGVFQQGATTSYQDNTNYVPVANIDIKLYV